MNFYKACWDYRNEVMFDQDAQRERAIRWCQNAKAYVERKEPMQVKPFALRKKIVIDRYKIEMILQ